MTVSSNVLVTSMSLLGLHTECAVLICHIVYQHLRNIVLSSLCLRKAELMGQNEKHEFHICKPQEGLHTFTKVSLCMSPRTGWVVYQFVSAPPRVKLTLKMNYHHISLSVHAPHVLVCFMKAIDLMIVSDLSGLNKIFRNMIIESSSQQSILHILFRFHLSLLF